MVSVKDVPQYTSKGDWECDYSFRDFTLKIEQMIKEDNLQLNPDFQRGRVWTEQQQIAFIEHIISGGENGRVVYLNSPDWGCFEGKKDYLDSVCVDGLQRITAVSRFVKGEIKAHGYCHDEYKHFRTFQGMKININNLQTKKEVLKWYLEMNSGGTPHTEQELDRVRRLVEKESEQ